MNKAAAPPGYVNHARDAGAPCGHGRLKELHRCYGVHIALVHRIFTLTCAQVTHNPSPIHLLPRQQQLAASLLKDMHGDDGNFVSDHGTLASSDLHVHAAVHVAPEQFFSPLDNTTPDATSATTRFSRSDAVVSNGQV